MLLDRIINLREKEPSDLTKEVVFLRFFFFHFQVEPQPQTLLDLNFPTSGDSPGTQVHDRTWTLQPSRNRLVYENSSLSPPHIKTGFKNVDMITRWRIKERTWTWFSFSSSSFPFSLALRSCKFLSTPKKLMNTGHLMYFSKILKSDNSKNNGCFPIIGMLRIEGMH